MAKKNQKSQKETVASDQENLIKLIEKTHGAGSVMKGRGKIVNVDTFPTGVLSIDLALGCKGLPQGRIIEIYGPESGGKTTTCLQFIAACQQHTFEQKEREGVCAFIDAEHALDPDWAERIGVDMEQLLLSQPNSGEEAFSIVEMMVKSKLVDLIVIDSVAALVPQAELSGELPDSNIGAHARLMSKALRRLKGDINNSKTTVIFINQIREKVGVVFGSPETTPGGRALKFYASVRGEVRRGSAIKEGDEVLGFKTSIKMVKNKVAPPFMRGEFEICVGKPQRPICGIDTVASVLDVANDYNIVSKNGNWFVYGDKRLGNGMSQSVAFLRDNIDILNAIREEAESKIFKHIESKSMSTDKSVDSDELDNAILDDDE